MRLFRRLGWWPGLAGSSVPANLPGNIVALMERAGRYEAGRLGPAGTTDATEGRNEGTRVTMQALWPFAEADPAAFMAALAAAVTPAGGWAAYGAARTAVDLVAEPDRHSPAYRDLMDGAIEVLRRHGIPPKWVPDAEWDHWIDQGGTLGNWLPHRPPPTEENAPISPLAHGETRPIARLTPAPDSNILLVDQIQHGTYSAVIDARRDDDGPHRSRWGWRSAPSLHDLYLDIGRIWQVPPYWCHPELAPFFPLPKPAI